MSITQMWTLATTMNKRGMIGVTGAVIGVVIAIIVIVAVAIPVANQVISEPALNSNDTTETVVKLIPMFLGLAGLVVVAALFG